MGDLSNILGDFDARRAAEEATYTPVPPGEYLVEVRATEWREARSGMGKYLSVTLEIVAGPFAARHVQARFNLDHSSAEARRIARGEFGRFCLAVGIDTIQDTIELVGRRCRVLVEHERDANGTTWERVRAYQAVGPRRDDDIPF